MIALVGALALAAGPALAASADPAVGTITVTVTDGVGGAPLQGMFVQTMGTSNSSGSTDALGQVTLTGLPNDVYTVNAGDPALVFQNAEVTGIEVSDATPNATATVALTRFPTGTGIVKGRILDRVTGDPIEGAQLSIGGGVTSFKSTTTDSTGAFEFTGLAVDVDHLNIFIAGYVSPAVGALDVDNDTTDLGDLYALPTTSSVVGRVIDTDGNPVANMPVEVNPADPNSSLGSASGWTDSDGYYDTGMPGRGSLAAGDYIVSAGLHGTVFAAQQIAVTVPDSTTVTVNITLVPRETGIVVGSVADSNGAPISGICVFALNPTTRQPVAVQITDEHGDWGFTDLTVGSYLFRMRSCENPVVYGASYLGGTTPAEATVVDVHAGDDLAEDVTTLLPEATISGHVDVTTATGTAPVPDQRGVILQVWQLSGGDWVIFDADTADTSATNGDYTIRNLPAGSYRIEFYDSLESRRAYTTQYWSQSTAAGSATLDDATTITLATGGSRTGIDAHMSAERPDDAPDAVSTGALAPADQKTLTTTSTVAPGGHLTVSLGTEHAGEWVTVWGHSTPTLLADWVEVAADGTVSVSVPTTFPTGSHRLVAQSADGTVIGWEQLTVANAAVVTPPAGSTPILPSTTVPSTSTSTSTTSTSTTAAGGSTPTPAATATAAPTPNPSASAQASSGGGAKATSPVVSTASTGLPAWLIVLVVGLAIVLVAAVIVGLTRRARAAR